MTKSKRKKENDGESEKFAAQTKKSKRDDGRRSEEHRPVTCILHASGIEPKDFTPLSQVRESATDKLAQLHSIRDKRLQEPPDSANRMEDVCNRIPESLDGANLETTGYHRACYQRFTMNLARLQRRPTVTSQEASTSRSPRKSHSSAATRLFPPECIFCGKLEVKVLGKKTERCIKFAVYKNKDGSLKEPTWKQIEPQALELGLHHLHRMVQCEDLFARDANYHQSCRKSFNLKYANHKRVTSRALATSPISDTEQNLKAAAHQMAFTAVLDVIQDLVIQQKKVVQLASLRLVYTQELERNGSPNPEYRSEKLKTKLEKHEGIAFAKVAADDKGCITFNLVYNANLSVSEAVACAYKLGSKDKYEDVALLLHDTIKKTFRESKSLPWPPTADDLEVTSLDDLLPSDLMKFLTLIISGDADIKKCEKTRRLVLSISQV